MKKFLLMAVCLITVAGTVSAQRYDRRYQRRGVRRPAPVQRYDNRRGGDDFYTPKVGLAGGVNFSNTVDAYNSDFSTSTIAGWHAGLTFEVPIAYPLSFAPEILFSQKGYKAETIDGTFKQRTNYVDIPLLAKFRLVPGFNFVIGPQLTFITSTRNTYDDGFNIISESEYNYRGDKSYISGVVGVGINLNRNVELRGRYAIDLDKNYANGNSAIPDYRNQVFSLGLGFKFN
ncbi:MULTISPECIES: porin family protein [unclassified Mucilaginibacter]|uniref:porin family protein n=1 Tax=unclassified Mucilaginibacter TaxID=2617802 RepID=UPI002AC96A9E|nr:MULTISPECIES: porin family protein [unclassified Mucilaginibacter]MEB0262771.1 porin family protein [Mucilaginibacter sp. 10I4]MEB0280197.1 porin family protein [Mucilaginibacter sp. 10B2]MEB0302934.1 porin family protein [Mucilaginibacter sp. 5C4]WPX24394.1 porin family protein [Mucilaginibacter sp. 5C4]